MANTFISLTQLRKTSVLYLAISSDENPPSNCRIFICLKIVDFPLSPGPLYLKSVVSRGIQKKDERKARLLSRIIRQYEEKYCSKYREKSKSGRIYNKIIIWCRFGVHRLIHQEKSRGAEKKYEETVAGVVPRSKRRISFLRLRLSDSIWLVIAISSGVRFGVQELPMVEATRLEKRSS